ncbi:hypothetical protein BHE74_00044798 [Ensete ventricosum]|uniref:EMC1 first beta-propeller domain-containing protein n=1 Tax=Ensete ventricosum TaxID=4639 RepID=A0A444DVY0_ENSVE|nr:hypothetical protein GW17_00034687 [Ensete ventricosum]RWW49076.1 hypothetical protein BHE74_00044798 [Ensete ventricosum]RZR74881.1 hypothetical protein BHM03_00045324 [Ensete ventricosum]
MAIRAFLGLMILLLFSSTISTALFEDQVGLADWFVDPLFSLSLPVIVTCPSLSFAPLWNPGLHDVLEIQQVFQPHDSDTIYALGFIGSSEFVAYYVNYKTGEVLEQSKASFESGFCGEASLVSDDVVVALDASRTYLVSISFRNGVINFHQMYIPELIPEFSGKATLLPSMHNGILAVDIASTIVMLRVKGVNELKIIEKINHPSAISDALPLSKEQQAFAILQHDESRIHYKVKFDTDLTSEVLKETIQMDGQRGNVDKVFINNYIRTDKTHGFRVLVVMEDHSLLLVQQGEIVWSREDGLASIVDSTTSELPVEKEGVSVAEVEHSLFEWLKVLFLSH